MPAAALLTSRAWAQKNQPLRTEQVQTEEIQQLWRIK
eukprot:COSAG02_NODE_646_length_18945_cov_17.654462_3_plen_37_part_00